MEPKERYSLLSAVPLRNPCMSGLKVIRRTAFDHVFPSPLVRHSLSAWAVGLCTVGGDVATDAMLSPHLIYLLRSKTLSLRSGGSSLTKLGQVGCVLVYGGTLSVPTAVDVVAKQRATRSD